jgi:CBS domain-containing protein
MQAGTGIALVFLNSVVLAMKARRCRPVRGDAMRRYVESFAKKVMTAAPGDSLASVAHTMDEHNVGAVVVAEHHRPVGIVTDRDLALGARGLRPQTPVARVMAAPGETIGVGDGAFQATQTMRKRNVRRLAVVDDTGDLAGIVTLNDLLRLLRRELANLVDGIGPVMQVR